VFIPVSGWIADRLAREPCLRSQSRYLRFIDSVRDQQRSLAIYDVQNSSGMGGAMMVPVGRLVVLRVTEKKDLMRSIAYITWPGLAAPVIGPPAGGFITTYLSWRWIFFLNVPLGIIGIVLALLWIRNQRKEPAASIGSAL